MRRRRRTAGSQRCVQQAARTGTHAGQHSQALPLPPAGQARPCCHCCTSLYACSHPSHASTASSQASPPPPHTGGGTYCAPPPRPGALQGQAGWRPGGGRRGWAHAAQARHPLAGGGGAARAARGTCPDEGLPAGAPPCRRNNWPGMGGRNAGLRQRLAKRGCKWGRGPRPTCAGQRHGQEQPEYRPHRAPNPQTERRCCGRELMSVAAATVAASAHPDAAEADPAGRAAAQDDCRVLSLSCSTVLAPSPSTQLQLPRVNCSQRRLAHHAKGRVHRSSALCVSACGAPVWPLTSYHGCHAHRVPKLCQSRASHAPLTGGMSCKAAKERPCSVKHDYRGFHLSHC